ncbi:MAG TPA: MaoC family dehydratase [Rhizomicrobium sp.]|nr:MaoC family dehydratase [Rhizomicrobium sp.]
MWFEDIEIGARREIGSYTFTEDEIIAFAQKYDPQVFHLDPVAAKDSMFGGLVASGWHTAAIWMKLMIDSRKDNTAKTNDASRAGVSPGFENMRWMKPVRPGMTITYTSKVTEKVDLKSRPELGLVKSLNEARDESGDVVMRFTGKGFVPKRPKA